MSELHSLNALRQAADYLRAEERHWWADAIMAAIETLTRDDNMAEAIERVRELHTPGDEWCDFHESARCECADAYCEECGDSYPCPTIQALDGSADPEPVDLCRCDGAAYEVQRHPFLVHPECPLHTNPYRRQETDE